MSLTQFFSILWARRFIILTALLSCLVVAIILAETLPPRYTGRARVMMDVVKPDPVTGQVVGGQFLRAYTRTQIELIKDQQVAGQVVDQLGWANNPTIVQNYEASAAREQEDIRYWLARQIIANTDADLIEASNILEITFRSSNPDTARRVAGIVRDAYVEQGLDSRRQAAGRTADWYQTQAQQARALLVAAETERANYAKAHNIVLNAANIDLESARLDSLSGQSAAAVGMGTAVAGTPAGPAASPSLMQLDTVDQQIAQAAATLGPNHPALQSLKRQRVVLAAAAARERAQAGRGGGGGGSPTAAVNAAYERQKQLVVQRGPEVDRVQNMTRDIEQKREQLAKLAERAAESRLSANVGETGLTPMGAPLASLKPDFPNKPLILSAAAAFGSILGICLALLIELLGRRIRSTKDLEFATGAPVFAEVPIAGGSNGRLAALFARAQRLLPSSRRPVEAM